MYNIIEGLKSNPSYIKIKKKQKNTQKENKQMTKAIYKNYKTGKYYTFTTNEATNESQIFTVFVDDHKYDAEPIKLDKNGKAYKAMDVKQITLKNGFDVFVLNN